MATETLILGDLDERASRLVERLTFPILEDVGAIPRVFDALIHAVKERKGVLCVGPKGTGKTLALRYVIDQFEKAEAENQRRDAKYRRRRIVRATTLRATTHRDALIGLMQVVLGFPPVTKIRGRSKTDDELKAELLDQLSAQRVALLVIDEAETLSDAALAILRDILSVSEATSGERFTAEGYAPAGVGILLLGTWDLYPRVLRLDEAGQRWVRVEKIGLVPPAKVPDVYRRLLPALDRRASEMGPEGWADFITGQVSQGNELSLRVIENHVRAYCRRMVSQDMSIRSVDDIGFKEKLFTYTWSEAGWQIKARSRSEAA